MSSAEPSFTFRAGERINLSSAEVLLVESQPESLEVLVQMFAGFGVYNPHRATNLAEAKQAIAHRTVNLIVVSNVVSGGDGYAFIQWLRRSALPSNRIAPVILLSGHTRESDVVRGRDCGANFVLRKPASATIMMQRILWISRDQREFVEAPNYCGVDRRFKMLGPPDGVKGRRKDDLSVEVGEAKTPNLDQDDIDALFQPRRAM
jgi:DNA-binding response OmpR family regulator